jgi:hypothetical protein
LERVGYKDSFIAKKKAARANIQTLKNGLDVLKESELKDLQEEFRGIDMEFKAMGLMADKDQLFDGPKSRSGGGSEFDPKTAKNSEVLSRAKSKEIENLDKLKEANVMVHATKEQGVHIAAQLKQDVEKIDRISAGLDDVTGELALSKIYITRVIKRMATDKVILAFAFLLIFAIIGIIVYSIVGKGQTVRGGEDSSIWDLRARTHTSHFSAHTFLLLSLPPSPPPPVILLFQTFSIPCVDSTGINVDCGSSPTPSVTPTFSPSPTFARRLLSEGKSLRS